MSESMKNKMPIVLVSVLLGQQDTFTEEVVSTTVARDAPCASATVIFRYSDATIGMTVTNNGLFAIGDMSGTEPPAVVNLTDLVRWAKGQNDTISQGSERVH